MELVASTAVKARTLSGVITKGRRAVAKRMSALASASDAQVASCYGRLVATLERTFLAEERLMEAVDFRAVRPQREQHARALSALHQATSRIEAGDVALAREALALLGRFLLMQRAAMDVTLSSALAPGTVRARQHSALRRTRRHRPPRAPLHAHA